MPNQRKGYLKTSLKILSFIQFDINRFNSIYVDFEFNKFYKDKKEKQTVHSVQISQNNLQCQTLDLVSTIDKFVYLLIVNRIVIVTE